MSNSNSDNSNRKNDSTSTGKKNADKTLKSTDPKENLETFTFLGKVFILKK